MPFHASCSPSILLDAENVVDSTLDGTSIWSPVGIGLMEPPFQLEECIRGVETSSGSCLRRESLFMGIWRGAETNG